MKLPKIAYLIGIIVLVGCTEQAPSSQEFEKVTYESNDNQGIELIGIDDHPNKEQMEWFLNNYDEPFHRTKSYKEGVHSFCTHKGETDVELRFYENQTQAIESQDSEPMFDNEDYCFNGAVKITVYSNSIVDRNDILSWFSGEE